MIYVTQGHERGVGLEIYLKSIICLPNNFCKKFLLIAYKATIKNTLLSLNISFEIKSDVILIANKILNYIEPPSKFDSCKQSTATLLFALETLKNKDTLFTLPTSKDQLTLNNQQQNGYTEFLRNYFNKPALTMSFIAPSLNVSLITDHISVSKVSSTISSELIINKIQNAISTLSRLIGINEIIFSGINPHAGENGLIGNEDSNIDCAIKSLANQYSSINFKGPLPGDTVYFSNSRFDQLIVYMYHDQGLSVFKALNGLVGANITCGLPFIRASVDHGTAFDLYGKNLANYQGCLYTMRLLANAPHSRGH